ncbi:hypothetical protein EJ06DRAFT_520673 [Trichodelitschia bisporula]|uniref:Secreted protein n=1 Tax=Trichodelitschia bisporula TaxID=703511 RepID=A0A6G1I0H4_9PEZI|nr:hypothetical protein EJ06DRAFT_520673 [Trichodelitschia bisporula]
MVKRTRLFALLLMSTYFCPVPSSVTYTEQVLTKLRFYVDVSRDIEAGVIICILHFSFSTAFLTLLGQDLHFPRERHAGLSYPKLGSIFFIQPCEALCVCSLLSKPNVLPLVGGMRERTKASGSHVRILGKVKLIVKLM